MYLPVRLWISLLSALLHPSLFLPQILSFDSRLRSARLGWQIGISKMVLSVQIFEGDQLSWVVSSEGRCSKDEAGRTGVVTCVWQGLQTPVPLWISDMLSLVDKRHHLGCWWQNGREVGSCKGKFFMRWKGHICKDAGFGSSRMT